MRAEGLSTGLAASAKWVRGGLETVGYLRDIIPSAARSQEHIRANADFISARTLHTVLARGREIYDVRNGVGLQTHRVLRPKNEQDRRAHVVVFGLLEFLRTESARSLDLVAGARGAGVSHSGSWLGIVVSLGGRCRVAWPWVAPPRNGVPT